MSQEIPTNKLSVYLIKEEYSEHKDILKKFDTLQSKNVNGVGVAQARRQTELGSKTVKGEFANEKAICRKFNAWGKDKVFDFEESEA